MNSLTLHQLEQAINYWRKQFPASNTDHRLCPQAAALAEPYALMILSHCHEINLTQLSTAARQALSDWTAAQTQMHPD